MRSTLKRVKALERSRVLSRGADPYGVMQRLALQHLSDETLSILAEVIGQGKPETEWTDAESAAIGAYNRAVEAELKRAGFRSVRQFEQTYCRVQ
jgi:hypothetical protein